MRKHLAIGVAALAAVAAAGCGGSSNRSTGYGSFDAQLNSLCVQARNSVKAANGSNAKLAVIQTYNQKFQDLTPPSQLKAIFDQFNSVNRQLVDVIKSGDLATAKSLTVQSNTLASSLGAAQCVTNTS